jgi:hypothetical protein
MTYFEESQRFDQWWLRLLIGALAVWCVGMPAYGLYHQFVLGKPWGDRPFSDTGLIVFSAFMLSVGLGLFVLFQVLELRTRVTDEGLQVDFRPFVHRLIRYDQIRSAEARRYNPILEYGGWGLRYGRNGQAYNVSGDRGVQLTLSDGRGLLIGSRKDEALAAAINARLQSR